MYGLVLEGGGSKGAYQAGALRAISELGIQIGGVAGTSVGALNGAMLVQGKLEMAYELWENITPSQVISFSKDSLLEQDDGLTVKDFSGVFRKIKKIVVEKGLDIEPLVRTVNELVDEETVRESSMEFGIVTFDLTDKRPIELFKEDIPAGQLKDYLIASASFPGFKLRTIDGRVFIDGGVYNSLPINLMKEKGFKDIIVIRTYGVGRKKKIDTTGLNITSIAPLEGLGPILDFSRERSLKNLKLGYYDALKVFKKLKGTKYYIEPLNDERYYMEFLFTLSQQKAVKICELFGIDKCVGKRALFEQAVPKIAELLKLNEGASYEDIFIGLMEAAAEVSGVERFKIYSVKDFLIDIALRYKPAGKDFLKEIPSFLRGLDVVSRLIREQIISSIAGELFEEAMARVS